MNDRPNVDALRAQARASLPLVIRYDMVVRYAHEMGWLLVRDPFDGEWHAVQSVEAPPSWKRAAYLEKKRRQRELDEAAA